MVSATWEYLSCPGVTCSVREAGRGHGTNMQLLSPNYQLIKDGVKEKLETLHIFTIYLIITSTEGAKCALTEQTVK